MKLELSLPPKHLACIASGAKHLVLHGGRASMKSTTAAWLCIARALEKKRKIVCGRQFQASIKHSSKSLIEEWIEKLGLRSFSPTPSSAASTAVKSFSSVWKRTSTAFEA
jgi:phage terminase large subunit